jgi:hypothetical protein
MEKPKKLTAFYLENFHFGSKWFLNKWLLRDIENKLSVILTKICLTNFYKHEFARALFTRIQNSRSKETKNLTTDSGICKKRIFKLN